MIKLWILFWVCLFVAFIVHYRDKGLLRYEKRDYAWTLILILIVGLFSGLRTWYNDTVTYRQIYDYSPLLSNFWIEGDTNIAHGVGFLYITSAIKTLGLSTQDYFMIFSLVINILNVTFLKKYASNFLFAVFLFFATSWFTFSLAAIKQSLAMAVCLWAVHMAIEKKWSKYFILMLIAISFHPYSAVYFIVPFIKFRPWTSRTYLLLFTAGIVGLLLEQLLGSILNITDMIGAEYKMGELTNTGVSGFRVLVSCIPIIITFIYQKQLFRDSDKTSNIMVNLAMLNGVLMFIGLFGTANYFGRLANYFLPAQTIVLPWIISKIGGKDGQFIKISCILGYFFYFYYSNGIDKPFDDLYSSISLWDYINSLWR